MDFRVVENLLSLSTEASNNGGSLASGAEADVNNLTLYGSLFLNRESPAAESDSPAAKVAGISSRGGDTAKISLQQSINGGASAQPRHQMLSFSAYNSPPLSFPFSRSSPGYGVRGPFTSSQWMELEHQALIYKYITANVPIPSYLLLPIRKAFESSGISCFSFLRSNALGWGGFQLGFSKNDPEPGRCRRTDGKKWRCSRDAVADQKYCERHVNRGRHRSRKHVEAGTTTTTTTAAAAPTPSSVNRAIREKESAIAAPPKLNQPNAHTSSEFGSVCSDSLLNPLSSSHALRHFIDEWPKSHSETRPRTAKDKCETEEATKMGLGIGPAAHSAASEQSQRHNYWVPTSWEPSAGGPLGEALHATSNGEGKCKNKRAHDFMETRLHSSSPVGARRGGPGAEGGDGAASFCNGIISSGFMLPSLPAL